jgi:hypothetical protein
MANDRAFAAAGIERHVAFEINDLQTILDLVDGGLGVAILPRSLAPLRTRLRFIRLRGEPPRWNVTLVAPPLTSPARPIGIMSGATVQGDTISRLRVSFSDLTVPQGHFADCCLRPQTHGSPAFAGLP